MWYWDMNCWASLRIQCYKRQKGIEDLWREQVSPVPSLPNGLKSTVYFVSLIPHFLGLLITGCLNEYASFPNAGGWFFMVCWISTFSMLFSVSPVPVQGHRIWDPSSVRVLQLMLAGSQDSCFSKCQAADQALACTSSGDTFWAFLLCQA